MHKLFKYLTDQHSRIEKLVGTLEEKSMRGDNRKADDFIELKRVLAPHIKAEDEVFYPLLLEDKDARIHVFAAMEIHHLTCVFLIDLDEQQADDERWAAQFKVLRQMSLRHMDDEEDTLFPFFKETESDVLDQVLEKMREVERTAAESLARKPVGEVLGYKSPELTKSPAEVEKDAESLRTELKSKN